MANLRPEDFTKGTIISQARALRDAAIARSGSFELDPKTMCWLITLEAHRKLRLEYDPRLGYVQFDSSGRWWILGLPARITTWDPPDTPELQLVMEPILVRRR